MSRGRLLINVLVPGSVFSMPSDGERDAFYGQTNGINCKVLAINTANRAQHADDARAR